MKAKNCKYPDCFNCTYKDCKSTGVDNDLKDHVIERKRNRVRPYKSRNDYFRQYYAANKVKKNKASLDRQKKHSKEIVIKRREYMKEYHQKCKSIV